MGNNFDWREEIELNEASMDARFDAAVAKLKLNPPKLNREEYDILKFCHERDMKQFLKEEFEKHPIILNEQGELVGENPFDVERRMKDASKWIQENR